MNKKHTAVEWLGYELNTKLFYDITPELWEQVNEIFKQALQMEQEQMAGMFISGSFNREKPFTFLEYYREIYGERFGKKLGGQDE
jgi:hypothetical protein